MELKPTVLAGTIEILLKTMIQIALFDIYLIQSKNKIKIDEDTKLSSELVNNLKFHPFYSIITSLHNLNVRLGWGEKNGRKPWDDLVIEDKEKLNKLSVTEKLLILFENELRSPDQPTELKGSNLSDVLFLNIEETQLLAINNKSKSIDKLLQEQLQSKFEIRKDIESATTKFRINKIKEYQQSQRSDNIQENWDLLASLLGLANAIFGNGVGLSLAPLFIF